MRAGAACTTMCKVACTYIVVVVTYIASSFGPRGRDGAGHECAPPPPPAAAADRRNRRRG